MTPCTDTLPRGVRCRLHSGEDASIDHKTFIGSMDSPVIIRLQRRRKKTQRPNMDSLHHCLLSGPSCFISLNPIRRP